MGFIVGSYEEVAVQDLGQSVPTSTLKTFWKHLKPFSGPSLKLKDQ